MEESSQKPDLTEDELHFLGSLMPDDLGAISESGFQPRHFLEIVTIAGRGLPAAYVAGAQQLLARRGRQSSSDYRLTFPVDNGLSVSFRINDTDQQMRVDARVTLLDALREQLRLTGTKKGCDHGQCGACTVLIEGRRVLACLTLLATCEGKSITTVEGLAEGGNGRRANFDQAASPTAQLHPMQAAFIKHDAFQCGYCTPGQLCSAVAMLTEVQRGEASYVTADIRTIHKSIDLTDGEIQERMAGNLCRCGAYPHIIAAIREVYSGTDVAEYWPATQETNGVILSPPVAINKALS